ncbi:MetQ/NlpA family ABC transporter substrate-binding protein [Aerococcus tenax]|uniref:MetQ/NlpA family ABC transporter substrate-binding protein n=1 Tax=Aerococcus tenax TaxID=3078812 RepID=UPI0018A6FBCD|nr:MetQ/NlpA family ABC transporter substrate-binding protein [Aerococcus tenax]
MKKWILRLMTLLAAFTLVACQSGNTDSNKTVKVGVVGEKNDEWDYLKDELKEKEGIDLELVKFTDYRMPIEALEHNEIDMHAALTEIYMDNMNEESGYHNTTIGYTTLNPMGVFSNKIEKIDQVKEGDKVAVPNDVSNESRALLLLQEAGLIKLNPDKGLMPTVEDITENPKNLEFITLDSNQTASALNDVTISCINNDMAADAGFVPTKDSIYLEKATDSSKPYWNVIAVDEKNKDNETYKKIVKYYQTPEVAKIIDEKSNGSSIPIWESQK